jgi:hypothetical protein
MNMRTMLYSTMVTLVIGAGSAAASGGGGDRSSVPLEGAWQLTINPVNCQTGVPSPVKFVSFIIFSAGGTVAEATSNTFFQAGQRSPGLGYWERTSRTFYHSIVQAYIEFDSVDPIPPAPMYVRGIQTLDQTIKMQDGDHWTSDALVTFHDVSGATVPPSGCAKAAAVRM